MKIRLILLKVLLCCIAFPAFSQDDERDTLQLPDLKMYRVYKSIHAASLQPVDSVLRLDLRGQKLKVLPDEIRRFKALKELLIAKNKLKELPEWIGEFKNLQILDASSNRLSALPGSIGNLESLVVLRLNRNVIEAIPYQAGNLKNLQVIEMWDNELAVVPDEMKNLHNLRVFELRGILFSQDEQIQIANLLPDTKIYFSPSCNCKD